MNPDTTKLDLLAQKYLDAEAAATAAATKAATAKTTREVAYAEMRGAAAEYAALHGGRASVHERDAMARVQGKLASIAAEVKS